MQQLVDDYRHAGLDARDRVMLDYAAGLTRAPASMRDQDVEALRNAGFDDHAILDIVLVTGYYAFANRLTDGLGVPLEDFWEKGSGVFF